MGAYRFNKHIVGKVYIIPNMIKHTHTHTHTYMQTYTHTRTHMCTHI